MGKSKLGWRGRSTLYPYPSIDRPTLPSWQIRAILANAEESSYDAILCDRIPAGSANLGPFVSQGPRIVLVFSSVDGTQQAQLGPAPYGFRARVEFKTGRAGIGREWGKGVELFESFTDFGIAGESIGGSNRCAFRFRDHSGSFNSPRYPANVHSTPHPHSPPHFPLLYLQYPLPHTVPLGH